MSNALDVIPRVHLITTVYKKRSFFTFHHFSNLLTFDGFATIYKFLSGLEAQTPFAVLIAVRQTKPSGT